jgi:hypothetical protein
MQACPNLKGSGKEPLRRWLFSARVSGESQWEPAQLATYFSWFLAWLFFLICAMGLGYCGHYWPSVPAPDDRWWWLWRNWWNEDWQGKPKYLEKTCHSATLSTTNPTWLDPGLNPGRHSGKPVTSRLSYGMTFCLAYSSTLMLGQYVLPNHLTVSRLHDVTTQKTVFLTVTAMRTSQPKT